MPGSYTLSFSVTNDQGITASARRRIIVYQASMMTVSLQLYAPADVADVQTGLQLVAALNNGSAAAATAAATRVLAVLPMPLRSRLEESDIEVLNASLSQPTPGTYGVAADVVLYVHTPTGVHRGDVRAAESAPAGAAANVSSNASSPAATRHLLASSVHTSAAAAAVQQFDLSHRRFSHFGSQNTAAAAEQAEQEASTVVHDAVHRLLAMLDEHSGSALSAKTGRGMLQAAQSSSNASSGALASTLLSLEAALASGMGATNASRQPLTAQEVDLIGVSEVECACAVCMHVCVCATDAAAEPATSACSNAHSLHCRLSHNVTDTSITHNIHLCPQAYMSALTSSVTALEATLASIAGAGSTLAGAVHRSFGDESLQRDAAGELAVTSSYQVRHEQRTCWHRCITADQDTNNSPCLGLWLWLWQLLHTALCSVLCLCACLLLCASSGEPP